MKNRWYVIIGLLSCQLGLSGQNVLAPSEAIELALKHNFGILIAQQSAELAENNADILNSNYLPTITAQAGGTYNRDNLSAEFSNGNETELTGAVSSRYNATLNLNYILFDGLGRRYNYKTLQEQHQLSQLEVRETIETTVLQLFSVYYTVAQLSENLDAINQAIEISKKRLTRAQYQYQYGQSTNLDLLNAQVDINNDSVNYINATQQLRNAKRDLNLLLGNALKDDFEVDPKIDFVVRDSKDSLWLAAQNKNVRMLQTERNLAIGELGIRSSKSVMLPSVGVTGSYGWNRNNNNPASFVLVSSNTGLSGGLTLTWNLFDGGRSMAQVSNAKINLETQQLQRNQIVLELERDFKTAWDNLQNRLLLLGIQQRNIATSEDNFKRTKEKYQVGQVTSVEFRQAQLNLLNAELSTNQAKYQAKLAELELLQISGNLMNAAF